MTIIKLQTNLDEMEGYKEEATSLEEVDCSQTIQILQVPIESVERTKIKIISRHVTAI